MKHRKQSLSDTFFFYDSSRQITGGSKSIKINVFCLFQSSIFLFLVRGPWRIFHVGPTIKNSVTTCLCIDIVAWASATAAGASLPSFYVFCSQDKQM